MHSSRRPKHRRPSSRRLRSWSRPRWRPRLLWSRPRLPWLRLHRRRPSLRWKLRPLRRPLPPSGQPRSPLRRHGLSRRRPCPPRWRGVACESPGRSQGVVPVPPRLGPCPAPSVPRRPCSGRRLARPSGPRPLRPKSQPSRRRPSRWLRRSRRFRSLRRHPQWPRLPWRRRLRWFHPPLLWLLRQHRNRRCRRPRRSRCSIPSCPGIPSRRLGAWPGPSSPI